MNDTERDLFPALLDTYDTYRAALRDLYRRAHVLNDIHEQWSNVEGECWRLLQDEDDIDSLIADNLASFADIEGWLGEVEDLLNDAAALPRYDDEDDD